MFQIEKEKHFQDIYGQMDQSFHRFDLIHIENIKIIETRFLTLVS